MDAPPPYVKEDCKSLLNTKVLPSEGYAGWLDWRLELRCGRAERIHAMANQVRNILNNRARSGLSRSTLMFIPSGQDITEEDAASRIETMTESRPLFVLLEDQGDTTEFWTQQEVLTELRSQILLITGASHDRNTKKDEVEAVVATKEPTKKRGWFSRTSKSSSVRRVPSGELSSERSSDNVQVRLTEVYVRRESALGLLETVVIQAILVEVVLE